MFLVSWAVSLVDGVEETLRGLFLILYFSLEVSAMLAVRKLEPTSAQPIKTASSPNPSISFLASLLHPPSSLSFPLY